MPASWGTPTTTLTTSAEYPAARTPGASRGYSSSWAARQSYLTVSGGRLDHPIACGSPPVCFQQVDDRSAAHGRVTCFRAYGETKSALSTSRISQVRTALIESGRYPARGALWPYDSSSQYADCPPARRGGGRFVNVRGTVLDACNRLTKPGTATRNFTILARNKIAQLDKHMQPDGWIWIHASCSTNRGVVVMSENGPQPRVNGKGGRDTGRTLFGYAGRSGHPGERAPFTALFRSPRPAFSSKDKARAAGRYMRQRFSMPGHRPRPVIPRSSRPAHSGGQGGQRHS